jgi:hypothetical protein
MSPERLDRARFTIPTEPRRTKGTEAVDTIAGHPDDVTPESGVSLVEHAFELTRPAMPPEQWYPHVRYPDTFRGDAAAELAHAIRTFAHALSPIERATLARELLPEIAEYFTRGERA